MRLAHLRGGIFLGLLLAILATLPAQARPASQAQIEQGHGSSGSLVVADVEETNAALVRAKDVLWALRRDRLRTAAEVSALAGRDGGASALAGFYAVQLALSSIDRLEVRGRDSAGLHLFVWDHGLDLDDPELAVRLSARGKDPLYPSGAVRVVDL